MPRLVGGVDILCGSGSRRGGLCLVDRGHGDLVWSTRVRRTAVPVHQLVPDVPGAAVLLDLLGGPRPAGCRGALGRRHGILHPRHAGSPPIWASSPRRYRRGDEEALCGQVDMEGMQAAESRPVLLEGRLIGVAIRPTAGSRRPIFVSPAIASTWLSPRAVQRLLRAPPAGAALLGRSAEPPRRSCDATEMIARIIEGPFHEDDGNGRSLLGYRRGDHTKVKQEQPENHDDDERGHDHPDGKPGYMVSVAKACRLALDIGATGRPSTRRACRSAAGVQGVEKIGGKTTGF